jgi:hypothetical protein
MLPVRPFVVPVRANEIDAVWSEAAPLIRLAQKRIERSTGMADIYGDLTSERTMLWLVRIEDKLQAVIITEIAKHPRRSAWRILLIGGSGMSEWLEYSIEAMKRAAKIAGCSAIEADGRLGWAKIAPRCGFKEVTRAYEMEI